MRKQKRKSIGELEKENSSSRERAIELKNKHVDIKPIKYLLKR